jgi:hypothetical protein
MNNTIILKHCEIRLTREEFKGFKKGNTICGEDEYPVEELKRWSIEDQQEAIEELSKYRCKYTEDGSLYNIEEYALEYCECDEDGEFIQGSDYNLAPEESEEE